MLRWLLIGLFIFPCDAAAQMLRGTVTDATSGAPVKATNLSLYSTDGQQLLRTLSDQDGKFEIVLPKGMTVYVQAERIGYATLKSELISGSTAEILQLNVRLSAVAIPLQGIEVAGRRQADPRLQPFLDRAALYKRASMGHIWTRSELERRHLALVEVEYLRAWVPRRKEIGCSGFAVFLDDLPVDTANLATMVAPEDLEGVEIYNDLEVPQDLLLKSRAVAGGAIRAANLVSQSAVGAATVDSLADSTPDLETSMLPPCETIMLWRKPYAELTARTAERPKKWHVVIGAALLATLLLVEEIVSHK